ncbi:MAG: peptidoglycan bridge formation protein FemAB [Porticoccaceae bacterium]|nr:peptidoglycan bridge formation protein FemAB [Porticoccaceae bacterium]
MEFSIKSLDTDNHKRWDDYVYGHIHGTFFHRAGWQTVIQRAFGHQTYFLMAESGQGDILGVLPLVRVKSRLFGHTLVSTPFCVYGGIIADSPAVEAGLAKAACDLAESLGVDALELRNRTASHRGWPEKELYATFRKTLHADHEENLKAIPNRQRAMVRKGIAEGLESEWCDGINRLYRVYSESVKNLGTPVFSKKYFSVLREVFGKDCDVLMITHQRQDVAGVLSFYFRDEVLPYYGGSRSVARTIRGVNHFMYWELMRHSVDRNFKVFDFGRSKKGSGPYTFKKNFGFDATPLHYEYFLVGTETVPDVNPNNPKYRFFIDMWKRLPLGVANTVGPFLARNLG